MKLLYLIYPINLRDRTRPGRRVGSPAHPNNGAVYLNGHFWKIIHFKCLFPAILCEKERENV